jgi:hypothetical protein
MLTTFKIYYLLFKSNKYKKLTHSNIVVAHYLLHEETCAVSLRFLHKWSSGQSSWLQIQRSRV